MVCVFCRENFKIMFNSTESDLTVFKLLEEACIELMKLSYQFKSQDGSQPKYRSVYCQMLWSRSHIIIIIIYSLFWDILGQEWPQFRDKVLLLLIHKLLFGTYPSVLIQRCPHFRGLK